MTSARIAQTFAQNAERGRTTLVAYLTVGYRNLEEGYQAARAALAAGADVLELGVPFSDPAADGPVIARASYEAIEQGGSLRTGLELAARLREESEAPLILFSYYNPIVSFGELELPAAAARAGVDGILAVDLPPDEGREIRAAARELDIAMIPLIAPTSGPEREQSILEKATGFVYYVSVTGVTGSGVAPLELAGAHAAELQEKFSLPVAVGFGIDSAEKARRAAQAGAQGVVVGTALVRALTAAPSGQGAAAVARVVSELRAGLDAAR